ncbi:hypothetical protein HK105_206152 [Polyrhizophydium stewartii]|uniref:Ankyrin repeat protein n=1 Tax=Polyrhizophydium stewartii TaxID=2732419 RepID=A0ABR4N4E9_9FUNG
MDAAAAAASTAADGRIDALEPQLTEQPAARLAADTNHLAAGVAALRLEHAAAAPPGAPAPYRRTGGLQPDAANEWDRLPAEVQGMILDAAGPFTKFKSGELLLAELRGLPDEQHKLFWRDAFDADWQGDLDLLPLVVLSDKSLHIRSRSFLQLYHQRFGAVDIARVAIRNGWTDMLDFGSPTPLALAAASEGALDILVDLVEVRKVVRPTSQHAEAAALNGHLSIIEFLRKYYNNREWQNFFTRFVVRGDSLDLVFWFKDNNLSLVDRHTLENAVRGNNTTIVRWILKTYICECSSKLFAYAAENDSLAILRLLSDRFPTFLATLGPCVRFMASELVVIEWLHERSLIDPHKLVRHVIDRSKADSLDWIMARFDVHVREEDLDMAHELRHNSVLKHVFTRGVPFTARSAQWAARVCNAEIMGWVVTRDRGAMPILVDATATHGHELLVEWWCARHGIHFGQRELILAVRAANLSMVKDRLGRDDIDWDVEAVRTAAYAPLPGNSSRRNFMMQNAVDAAVSRRAAGAK